MTSGDICWQLIALAGLGVWTTTVLLASSESPSNDSAMQIF